MIVVSACVLMWGHYWDASNGMTICSMVVPARSRPLGQVSVTSSFRRPRSSAPSRFPVLSSAWGTFWATMSLALLSLTSFLSPKFIMPEVYGHIETEGTIAPTSTPTLTRQAV